MGDVTLSTSTSFIQSMLGTNWVLHTNSNQDRFVHSGRRSGEIRPYDGIQYLYCNLLSLSKSCWNQLKSNIRLEYIPSDTSQTKKKSQPFQAICLCRIISFSTMSRQNKVLRLENWGHFTRHSRRVFSAELGYLLHYSTTKKHTLTYAYYTLTTYNPLIIAILHSRLSFVVKYFAHINKNQYPFELMAAKL